LFCSDYDILHVLRSGQADGLISGEVDQGLHLVIRREFNSHGGLFIKTCPDTFVMIERKYVLWSNVPEKPVYPLGLIWDYSGYSTRVDSERVALQTSYSCYGSIWTANSHLVGNHV